MDKNRVKYINNQGETRYCLIRKDAYKFKDPYSLLVNVAEKEIEQCLKSGYRYCTAYEVFLERAIE